LANNKQYLRAVLDENAIIQEFESTLGIECHSSSDVVGKNWFDIFIDSREGKKYLLFMGTEHYLN
jgi:hypothetical protein